MYRVELTDFARAIYQQMLDSRRCAPDGSATKRRVEDQINDVSESVRLLETMDPEFDLPLVGKYRGVNVVTCGQTDLWYTRLPSEDAIVVLHIGESSSDTTSTYHCSPI